MMDCSKTEVFLAELKRMHKANKECITCPLGIRNNGEGCTCDKFLRTCGEKAIKIVQEWSDQHPVKTRLSVLKEQYPNMQMRLDGTPKVCCTYLYNTPFPEEGCTKEMCMKCWNTPIEDGKCSSYVEGETPRCMGTKEIDVCSCGGDKSKCDFYPQGVQ